MDWLLDRFLSCADEKAVVYKDKITTYNQMYNYVCEWKDIIYFSNVPKGAVVSVEGESSPWVMAAIIALIENKNIIVPINSINKESIDKYLKVANVQYRLDSVSNKVYPSSRNIGHKLYEKLTAINASGLVLFSSGTTGEPKGTVLNFDKMAEKFKKSDKNLNIMSFLSFDHIGGINTIFYTLSSGGLVVIPKTRQALDVLKDIQQWSVEILPTTPTFINMLLMSGLFENYDLSSLKLITYGTEPMPKSTLTKISTLLTKVKFKQTYGLSEVGILPTKSKNNHELWLKIGGKGFDYRVKDNILWIKSDTAMLGYLNAESPFDEDGYFNTQDVIEFDEKKEYMKILGRKSEIINVGGEKVYPTEVENTILEVDDVVDVSVVGEKNPITGMGIKAFINAKIDSDTSMLRKEIINYCKRNLSEYKIPMVIVFIDKDLYSNRYKKVRKFERDHFEK
ncbi:hypothetical protein A3712_00305 [Vibrio sp. HI00D65]|uniref:ANL family adenylate-forming protein n=1 Tax=Vibrio sp. HI00D65 TaxID=1822216 RepID=UPI0007C32D31|nr:fatty acid--CoA ligase family protein [Vibrio sp. HI00D65]KZX70651.1 hypothetical protein A3712_00305 [Vibrio sp. HI00D65]